MIRVAPLTKKEQSSHSTVQFVKMAIKHFSYKPQIIQTDNGVEFTHFRETKQVHPLDLLCQELGIEHKLIRPRTPRHNGKVERNYRNDNRRFYQHLTFYSYDDLTKQMKRYLYRSNRLPMQTLGWKSPIDIRRSHIIDRGTKLNEVMIDTTDYTASTVSS